MAIRVNLYHEVLRAKRQEQYDPLKISLLVVLVVSIGLAGYYFIQLSRTGSAKAAFNTQKAEFERLSPLSKQAADREKELTMQVEQAATLTNRMENRFYWAPVFEAVAAAVPPNVQITKLTGETGRDSARQCQILMDGIAAGPEPRAAAEEMRKSIAGRLGAKYAATNATFRNMDDGSESAKLDGKTLPTVVFTIHVSFKAESEPVPAQKPIAQTK
jgi:Tfp pilus assembly protein PilN